MNTRTIAKRAYFAGVICLLCASTAFAADNYRAAMLEAVASKEKALDSDSVADWREALDRFRAATAIQRAPEPEYEVGFAAAKLGETGLAVEAYSNAIEQGLSGTAAERARAFVNENSTSLATLTVSGAPGTRIFVHGLERGQLPLTRAIVVEAGNLVLDIVSSEGVHTLRRINLDAGQRESISLEEPETVDATPEEPAHAQDSANSGQPLMLAPEVTRAQTSSNEPPASVHRQTAWAIVGTGSSLAALSAVSIIVSSSRVSASRRDLSNRCAVQIDGPDTCAHAKVDQLQAAQAASDSIATWKAVRTGSWLGLSLGIVGTITGVAWLAASPPLQRTTAQVPTVLIDPRGVRVTYQGTFF